MLLSELMRGTSAVDDAREPSLLPDHASIDLAGLTLDSRKVEPGFRPLYDWNDSIEKKIATIAHEMYGAEAVDYTARARRDRTQLEIRFERAGTTTRLAPEKQLALFRVLQECLSNAAKHAQPKAIEVKLHFGMQTVDLSVKDDGKGFEASGAKAGHYGLINMRERAMKVGGQVIIDSAPGKGAQISFSVPV